MPRGKIMKYELVSKLYRLKEEIHGRDMSKDKKDAANEYLDKLLLYINTFRY